jgi:hypothetical protein
MSQMGQNGESFTLTVDGSLFTVGFAVGLIIGKLLLKNTMLAVAFGTGFGLAVGTSANGMQEQRPARSNGTKSASRMSQQEA